MVFDMVFDLIVDKLLGAYLCIGERKLDFSSGTLTMKNVMVREDVLDSSGLPVALRGGEIGELEVQVPWTKLKTESVVVKINKLSLLLAPVSEAEWDEVAERDRVAACKERTLQRLRKQLQRTEPSDKEATEPNFAERLLSRVLANLQVVVTSALVRYEDHSHSHCPFALEVALDSLWLHPARVTSPDPQAPTGGAPGPAGELPHALPRREALVCALCAYVLQGKHMPPQPQRSTCSAAQLYARLQSSGLPLDAPAALRANFHRCCLQPLSFAMELCSSPAGATAAAAYTAAGCPQHVACLETGRLLLELELSEYAHLTAMASYLLRHAALEPHRRFRPPLEARPATHPRAWWRYAGDAVRWQVTLAREPYTWAALVRRGRQRRSFVHLHKKLLRKGEKQLSEAERVSLRQVLEARRRPLAPRAPRGTAVRPLHPRAPLACRCTPSHPLQTPAYPRAQRAPTPRPAPHLSHRLHPPTSPYMRPPRTRCRRRSRRRTSYSSSNSPPRSSWASSPTRAAASASGCRHCCVASRAVTTSRCMGGAWWR
jgi:vacuolar protein sorting-associated protein 13A/C